MSDRAAKWAEVLEYFGGPLDGARTSELLFRVEEDGEIRARTYGGYYEVTAINGRWLLRWFQT